MSRFQLLSDAQWSLIADLLPAQTGKQGRPFRDARQVVEGIIYRYRCGIAWRDVPAVFGPWQTIWTWHRRMSADGTWDVVLARLLSAAEAAGVIDWAVAVDSTIARAHQHATNVTRHTGAGSNYTNPRIEPPDHGIGRSRSRPKAGVKGAGRRFCFETAKSSKGKDLRPCLHEYHRPIVFAPRSTSCSPRIVSCPRSWRRWPGSAHSC